MMQQILVFFCMCALLSCASSQSSSENLQKFDAPLQQKLEALRQVRQAGDSDMIEVIGKCSSPITNEQKQKLCDTGATISTVAGDIFTASASINSIHNLAALDFVTRLELSQLSRPLQH